MSYVSTLRINLHKPPRCNGRGQGEGASESPAPVLQNGAPEARARPPGHPAFSRPLHDCSVPEGSDLTLEGHVTGTPPITISWLHNDMGRTFQSKSPQVSRVVVTSKATSVSSANGTAELEKGAVTMMFKVHPQHTREIHITGLRGSSLASHTQAADREKMWNAIPSKMPPPATLCAMGTAERTLTPLAESCTHDCNITENYIPGPICNPAGPSTSKGPGKMRNVIRCEFTVAANSRPMEWAERILTPLAAAHPQECRAGCSAKDDSVSSPFSEGIAPEKERTRNVTRSDITLAATHRDTQRTERILRTLAAVHPHNDTNAATPEKDVTVSIPPLARSSPAASRERTHNAPHTDIAVTANNHVTDQEGGIMAPLPAVHPKGFSTAGRSEQDVALPVSSTTTSGHASRRERTHNALHADVTVAANTPVVDQEDGILAPLGAVHPKDCSTAGLSEKDGAVPVPFTATSGHAARRARKHNAAHSVITVTANSRVTDQDDGILAPLPAVHPEDRSTAGLSDKDAAVPVPSRASSGHAVSRERTRSAPHTDVTVAANTPVADQEDGILAPLAAVHPKDCSTAGLSDKDAAVPVPSTATSGHGGESKASAIPPEMTVAATHRERTGNAIPSEMTAPGTVCPTKTAERILTAPAPFHSRGDSTADISENDVLVPLPPPASPCRSPDSVSPKRRALKSAGDILKLVDSVNCVEVKAGEQAELYCGILGTPPIAASWVKQKKQISTGAKTAIETTDTGSKLVIRDVQADDSGCYTLFVRDRTGSIHHQMSLSVIDRPQPPSGKPYVSALQVESLTLSWSGPCYDGGSAVQCYVVQVRGVGEATWRVLTDSCLSTSYRVKGGLEPEQEYQFRVCAVNAHGVSEPSEESAVIKMSTEEDASSTEPFEYRQVVINTTEKVSDLYTQLEKLGVGKFGQVYKLQEKASGKILAGKFYKTRTAKEKENARMEVELMNKLHHPKLAQCVAAYQTRAEMVMVLEYIAGGELFERIVDDSFEHTEPTCVQYVRQILEGVQYMHCQNIVHLDLKPENIVCVNKTGNYIKIIDFGLARMLDLRTQVKVMQGTPEFIAPEVIAFEAIGYTTDMWSIGVICYILLSGDSPFQGNNDMETLRNVTAAQWEFDEETFEEISDRAKDFISKLLKKNMRSRLTADQALEHPWLQETEQGSTKTLSKEKIKKFLARQKWQKTGKAVLALKRMSLLSNRQDNKVTSPDSPQKDDSSSCLNPQDNEVFSFLHQQIQRPPSFSKPLKDQVEVEGSSACLQCHIEGYPDPEVIWFQNDIPIQESGRFRIEYDESGSCSLIVSEVTQKDSGRYSCKAFNDLGEVEISAKLTVCPLHGARNR